MSKAVMQQALEALEKCSDWPGAYDECSRAVHSLRAALAEPECPHGADAERYRWLRDSVRAWSWNPDGRVYPDKVVGFAHRGTGYLDSEFQTAIDAARGKT